MQQLRLAIRFCPPKEPWGSQRTFALNFLPEFLRLAPDALVFTSLDPKWLPAGTRVEYAENPLLVKGTTRKILALLRYQTRFSARLSSLGINVLFCPFNNEGLIYTQGIRQVLIVHDLIPLVYPKDFPWTKWLWRFLYAPAIRQSKRIITVSEHTKKDLIQMVRYPAENIDTIFNGWSAGQISARSHANHPYLLCVSSSHYPHKNIERLLRAFALLKAKIPHELHIVGSPTPRFTASLLKLVVDLELQCRVRFMNSLSGIQMSQQYANAEMLIYPSLYEGFGLPILEAMAAGLPVCAGHCSSIPEVAGEAALYFDPEDVLSMASAINILLTDAGLRGRLLTAGYSNVQRFSWRKSASECMKTCEAACY